MPRERRGCGICDSITRTLVCPDCVNNTLLFERHKVLAELSAKRDAVQQRLNELISQRQAYEGQQAQRHRSAAAAQAAKQRTAAVKRELEAARQQADRLRGQNSARKARHELLSGQLAAKRAETLNNRLPTDVRYQSLHLASDRSKLLREQCLKLSKLLDILPLRITAIRSGGASPIQVTVCNLKVPDNLSASTLMQQQPEATASALGYMVLLQDLISTYLGGPVLHEGSFQGSTTVVWQQSSFWDRRPPSSNSRLPLFMEEGAGPGPLANPFPSLSSKVRGGGVWGGQQLSRSMSEAAHGRGASGPASSSGAGGGGGSERAADEVLARQRYTDLKLAFDMLQRSVACLVRDKAAYHSLQLPPSWSPFGWLVVLMSTIKRDERSDAVLAAAQSMLEEGSGQQVLFRGDADGHDDHDGEEVEEDGWDVVQAPFLPPPPSQPDEVEHWTRAMFTDAAAPRGPAHMSLERVKSMFSR